MKNLAAAMAPVWRPILREFSGEVIAFGPWQVLFSEPAFDNGMIVRFPDNEAALAWIRGEVVMADGLFEER
jgi:hypothetical protein